MSAENQPIRGFKDLTIGTDAAPGRLFIVNATVAGNVTVKGFDNVNHVIAVPAGYSAYPYSVRQVVASTATATYTNGL